MRIYRWSGVEIEGLDNLRRWHEAMKSRPACQKGIEVPYKTERAVDDEKKAEEAAKAIRAMVQT